MKLGRPKLNEVRTPMRSVTFRIDVETARKLDDLAAKVQMSNIRGGRSIVIRNLIHAAWGRK